jgi:hypothetical protein
MGQKATCRPVLSMSALPPKVDVGVWGCNVRFVPTGDSCTAANSLAIRLPLAIASRVRGMGEDEPQLLNLNVTVRNSRTAFTVAACAAGL